MFQKIRAEMFFCFFGKNFQKKFKKRLFRMGKKTFTPKKAVLWKDKKKFSNHHIVFKLTHAKKRSVKNLIHLRKKCFFSIEFPIFVD